MDEATTHGKWHEVWESFDRQKGAKVANDTAAYLSAVALAEAEDGDDMFARSGVAAK